jgi:murein L,D-transpeptidase YcbB/YkuD
MPTMFKKDWCIIFPVLCFSFLLLPACKSAKKPPPPGTDIVVNPAQLSIKITEILRSSLEFSAENNGFIDNYHHLIYDSLVQQVYAKNNFTPVWSKQQNWRPLGDSMLNFIEQAKLYGLFPEDYHFGSLDSIRQQFRSDSFSRKAKIDAVRWASADLLLTDAFMHIVKDIKLGRLPKDSVTLRADSLLSSEFYLNRLSLAQLHNGLSLVFNALEPNHKGYEELKKSIPAFLDSADYRVFTQVPLPRQKNPDFKKILQKRLYESGLVASDTALVDSATLSNAIKYFQRSKGITEDGLAGEETIRVMNTSDSDRFVRIAITLDRYKMLPEKMPDRYVWVNLPRYYMEFRENDTVKITSKIICGKPLTRTPQLTSAISELVTYPQWTVPNSIIVKEILPALKKNTGYLAKKGFGLINSKGEEVNPDSVNWFKYNKGIPYKVVQGSGDDNALGILKFNFPNKYAVYLHDTNQRYLFANNKRSLSHGCVRVQDWEKLAYSIIRFDYKDRPGTGPSPVEDSMTTWLGRKEKHSIYVRNRLPVYIRYLTCEAKNGKIQFYEDMYGEDKFVREHYFAGK